MTHQPRHRAHRRRRTTTLRKIIRRTTAFITAGVTILRIADLAHTVWNWWP